MELVHDLFFPQPVQVALIQMFATGEDYKRQIDPHSLSNRGYQESHSKFV